MTKKSPIDGLPVWPVTERSLVGIWCEETNYSQGLLVSKEIIFNADNTFVWRSLCLADEKDGYYEKAIGDWKLEGDALKLTISACDEGYYPSECAYFKIRGRIIENDIKELVMKASRYDDQNYKNGPMIIPKLSPQVYADEYLESYIKKMNSPVTIDSEYEELAQLLINEVPLLIKKLDIGEPIWCVRLYYFDTNVDGDSFGIEIRCLTDKPKLEVVKEKRPIDIPYYLWSPTSGVGNRIPRPGNGIQVIYLRNYAEFSKHFDDIHKEFSDSEQDTMVKQREVVRKAAKILNSSKWPKEIQLTNDFVVLPGDGNNYFDSDYTEDFEVCVSTKKIELLKTKGFY